MSIVGTISASKGNLTSTLTNSDLLQPTLNGAYSDDYQLVDVIVGQSVIIALTSNEYDTYLQLINANTGEVIKENDDYGEELNSRLSFVAVEGINYIVRVSGYDETELGAYQLSATSTESIPTNSGDGYGGDGYGGDGYGGDGYGGDGYGGDGYGGDGYGGDGYGGDGYGGDGYGGDGYGGDGYGGDGYGGDGYGGDGYGGDGYGGDGYGGDGYGGDGYGGDGYGGDGYGGDGYGGDNTLSVVYGESVIGNLTNDDSLQPTLNGAYSDDYQLTDVVVGQSILIQLLSFDFDTYLQLIDADTGEIIAENDEYPSFEASTSGIEFVAAEGVNYIVRASSTSETELGRYELFTEIVIPPLDLNVIENIVVPPSLSVHSLTPVSWSVENVGEGAINQLWYDEVYLSDDEYYDGEGGNGEDIRVAYSESDIQDSGFFLPEGESYSIYSEIKIPNTQTGLRYLLFVSDTEDWVEETDETNNVVAIPVKIDGVDVDLDITATASAEIVEGEAINLSWTVNNNGTVTPGSNVALRDRVYLSNDSVLDPDDPEIVESLGYYGALASGDSYTNSLNITLSDSVTAGSYYLFFVADDDNNQYETNETNNIDVRPLEILAPDVNLAYADIPDPFQTNANNQLNVSVDVTNIGTTATEENYWHDRIYWSTDEIYDSSDIELDPVYTYVNRGNNPLTPGDTYTKSRDFYIPDVESGTYYVLFKTDADGVQRERDEIDNLAAVAVEVVASPNFTITSTTVPEGNKAIAGDRIELSWTVANLEDAPVLGEYWYDDVYLSEDEYLDISDTPLLDYHELDYDSSFGSNDSYTSSEKVYLPNVEAKNYYLIFQTNSWESQGETDLSDNTKVVPFEIIDPANLVVSDAVVSAQVDPDYSIPISWEVTNTGEVSTSGRRWYDRVYLSTDEVYDENDLEVDSKNRGYYDYRESNALGAGESYTVQSNITLDESTELGNYYLLFITDDLSGYYYNQHDDYSYGRQAETDETDNLRVVPIEVIESDADLKLNTANAPNSGGIGETIAVDWTVINQGTDAALAGLWQDRIYLSDDPYFDQDEDDYVAYQSNDLESPLAAGHSYTSQKNINIPNTKAGDRYLLFVSDWDRQQDETDETNNVYAHHFKVEAPNLEIENISVTDRTNPGQGIRANWRVRNTGEVGLLSHYRTSLGDYVYLSTDDIFDLDEDIPLSHREQSLDKGLGVNASYDNSNYLRIPETLAPGNYNLLFVADRDNVRHESNEVDNIQVKPLEVTELPNLTIVDAFAPEQVTIHEPFKITWKAKNNGSGDLLTTGYTYDYIYLSDDQYFDGEDTLLASPYNFVSYNNLESGDEYSQSKNVTLHNVKSGSRYLLFVADGNQGSKESNESDNVTAVPIEINVPNVDLAITNTENIPLQGNVGSHLAVSWLVSNLGTEATKNHILEEIYFSEDNVLDRDNDLLLNDMWQREIADDTSRTIETEVILPNLNPGNYHLFIVSDALNTQAETDETNNIATIPFELIDVPNLVVLEDLDTPALASISETASVSWSVANTGNDTATSNFLDLIYLSEDTVWDDDDKFVGRSNKAEYTALAVGDNYRLTEDITLPQTAPGNYYLLFHTDYLNQQAETDETDNIRAVSIELQAPNLEITNTTDLSTVITGERINLSMTVTNTGAGTVFFDEDNGWHHNVYISDDEVFDYSDRRLWEYDAVRNLDLAPGESYTIESKTERISQGRIGSQYLLFVVDRYERRIESNEDDNITIVPIEVTAPNFTVTNAVVDDWAGIGQTIPVSWTVTNTGDVSSAPGSRYWNRFVYLDQVFISSDPQLDDSDTPIPGGIYNDDKLPLAAGDSYTIEQNITLPSEREGELYLLFKTDVGNWQGETDETDNVRAVPIFITDNGVNLKVTDANAPESATLGETIAIDWTTTNVGGVTASLDWIDRVYLSDDSIWDSSDRDLTEQATGSLTPLAAGGSYDVIKNITLPLQGAGTRYLIFKADDEQVQIETDDTDNTYVLPIDVLAPDLTITNPLAPKTAVLGESIDLSWIISNVGDVDALGSWRETIYLSDDQYHDSDDEVFYHGNTSSNLAAKAERTIAESVNVKRTTIGDRYLLFVADPANAQGETNEADNVAFLPIQLTALDVDLVVSDIVAPLESFAGAEVEVVWTVTNKGSDDATGAWTDDIYLAADKYDIRGNEIYGSFEFTGTVAAGESIERKQKITLPQTLEGNFNLIVKTDVSDRLIEYGKEDNNTTVREEPFTSILPTFPNLQVTNVTAPLKAFSSQSTVVEWIVTNTGDAATSAPLWHDTVWLSLDQNLDTADKFLGKATNVSYLNPGNSYNNSLEVDLPQGIDGNYYFIIHTDSAVDRVNKVFEFENENDNVGVSNISNIELTPPPDLQVAVNAPTFAFSGDYVSNFSWTVTNVGDGHTLQSSWYDEIFISTDTVWDSSDISLGRQTHRGILEPGESYTISDTNRRFELPEGISGDYHFIVRTDAGGQVYESALSTNNAGFDETVTEIALTPPPDLEISINAPNEVLASHDLTVDYSVTNYGSTPTPYSSWLDTFYLSEDDQLDSDDPILKVLSSKGVINIDGSRHRTINLTIPNGISGNYYLFAETDTNNSVFELDNANNTAFQALTIESKPADLAVSEVIVPSVIEAGTGAQISWTVINQGTGDTVENSWDDQIWLTLDSVVGNSDDRWLDSFTHRGLLQAGESYTNSELITIPFDLQGNYQLYIQTDRNNQVYEADEEANNTSLFLPVAIARDTPDLQVTAVTTSLAATSGESITVEWSVANSGTGKTNSNYWYDEVFLSFDSDLGDSSDVSLGKVYHSGSIEQGESYSTEHTFELPQDLDGDYRIIVRTDTDYYSHRNSGDRVLEVHEDNNETASDNSIAIALNTVPNLVIDLIDAPAQGISGQTFDLSWTIVNQGTEVGDSWTDVFYLSTDQVFDRSEDIYLGSKFNYANLGSGAESIQTASFEIPRGLSGRFYVFGITDSNNTTYEREGENNNIAFDGNSMNVILPPPADLATGDITVPTDGVPGQNITINYTVNNEGDYTVDGNWEDAIYLSEDDQWDINDPLIEKVRVYDSVESGESYSRTVSANLPGVATGDYYVIVRSDIRDAVPEPNETNNLAVSTAQINVDIELLEIDVPDGGFLRSGDFVYYRLEAEAGDTVKITLNSDSDSSSNELFVSYGQAPDRTNFDFTIDQPFVSNPEVVIPETEAGTYYIMARAEDGSSNYYIEAEVLPFGITELSTTEGGNVGQVTMEISGAQFDEFTTVELVKDGEVITPSWYRLDNASQMLATFDLTDREIGEYDVRAYSKQTVVDLDPTTGKASIREIVRGDALLNDGFTIVEGGGGKPAATLTLPDFARGGRPYNFALEVVNDGNTDLPVPVYLLGSPNNTPMSFDSNIGNSSNQEQIMVLGDLRTTVLAPGEIAIVPLNGWAVYDTSQFVIQDLSTADSPPNWSQMESYYEYVMGDEQWSQTWDNFRGIVGDSRESFYDAMRQSVGASAIGESQEFVNTDSVVLDLINSARNGQSDISSSTVDSSALEQQLIEFLELELNRNVEQAIRDFNSENNSFVSTELNSSNSSQEFITLNSLQQSENSSVLEISPQNEISEIVIDGIELDPNKYSHCETIPGYNISALHGWDRIMTQAFLDLSGEVWGIDAAAMWRDYLYPSRQEGYVYIFEDEDQVVEGFKNLNLITRAAESLGDLYNENVDFSTVGKGFKDAPTTLLVVNDFLNQSPVGIKKSLIKQLESGARSYQDLPDNQEISISLQDLFDKSGYTNITYKKWIEFFADELEWNSDGEQWSIPGNLAGGIGGYIKNGQLFDDTREIYGSVLVTKNVDECGNLISIEVKTDFKIRVQDALDFCPGNPGTGIESAVTMPMSRLEVHGFAETLPYIVDFTPESQTITILASELSNLPEPDKEDCEDDPPKDPPREELPEDRDEDNGGFFIVPTLQSRDPNDIIGPEGSGEEKWIAAGETLPYTIRFENVEDATAPAGEVTITHALDADLDWRTFRLGSFGWRDLVFEVPENRSFYADRLDLTEKYGFFVDVVGRIDIATGEASWRITTIDPETGEMPTDPLLGFLPPNDDEGVGEGFVTYTIRADRDIETAAVIDAEATIVFDVNEPINTPAIFNTIDAGKPTSSVEALPSVSDSEEFTVSWSGSDDTNGSAVADYTIYVAENGEEFTPWLEDTALTEAVFTGTPGSTYKFYAVARDNAGNVQDIPAVAQAEITISGGNNAPILVNPIEDLITVENTNFSFAIGDSVFIDSDVDDILSYTASLEDGSSLPDWLTFNEPEQTFTGTPDFSNVGILNIELTATDSSDETAIDVFSLEIQAAVEEKPTSTIGEFGKVASFDHKRQTIEFDHSYDNPVVFALPLSRNGGDPATVRITDISRNSFTAYLQEPQYKDGAHKTESFSYLVVEAGEWELSNGALLEVGTAYTRKLTTEGWLDLDFDTDFTDTPAILSQVQTYNGNQFVRTRQRGASADGFRVSMEEEEALKYSGHATEKIGWLAIESGSGDLGDLQYQAGHTDRLVNHRGYTLNFETSFESEPSLFASLASFYGGDSAGLRYKNLDNQQVRIILEEEQSLDAETKHVNEVVDFLAIEGTGDLIASVYHPVDFNQ